MAGGKRNPGKEHILLFVFPGGRQHVSRSQKQSMVPWDVGASVQGWGDEIALGPSSCPTLALECPYRDGAGSKEVVWFGYKRKSACDTALIAEGYHGSAEGIPITELKMETPEDGPPRRWREQGAPGSYQPG